MAETHFQIRQSIRADMQGIDTLLARAFPRLLKDAYPASVMVTAVPLMTRAQPALVTSGTYYVAEDEGGQIIGAGGWASQNPVTGTVEIDTGHVRHFATDPDWTRVGVASTLLSHCMTCAWEFGMTNMHALSTLNAVGFYQSCGFARGREVEVGLRAGISFPAVSMSRMLSRKS